MKKRYIVLIVVIILVVILVAIILGTAIYKWKCKKIWNRKNRWIQLFCFKTRKCIWCYR